jgi:hypothetical protein
MERSAVRIGGTYSLIIAGRATQVRITEEKRKGEKFTGYGAIDLATNRKVYVNTAIRLQPGSPAKAAKLVAAAQAGDAGPTGAPDAGVVLAKAGSPRPPKAAKAPTKGKGGKGKRKRVAPAGTTRKPRAKAEGRLSGLDAAAKVLSEARKPMRVEEIVEAAKAKGYWESKAGKTPGATIYAAIIREIRDKGAESRFVKKDRGLFASA